MKYFLVVISLLVISFNTNAQEMNEHSFDFWVGNWSLKWTDANGKEGKGQNIIETILDGKVIQENFEALEGQLKGYKGTSISVFNPNTKTWHQTWQDTQGGNLVFTGRIEQDKKYFESALKGNSQSRMVFHDFTDKGFTWDWESTQDGGKTWTLNWQIHYSKM